MHNLTKLQRRWTTYNEIKQQQQKVMQHQKEHHQHPNN